MKRFTKIWGICTLALAGSIGISSVANALDLGKVKAQVEQKKKELEAKAAAAQAPNVTPVAADQKKEPLQKDPTRICDASERAGLCYAFSGTKNADPKVGKGNQFACKLMKGKYSDSAKCPEPKAVGKCEIKTGDPEEYTLVYYRGNKLTKKTPEEDCKDEKSSIHRHGAGKWTAL